MLSPLSSHPEQRADLVAEYLDDVSHPMACGVPVVLKLSSSHPAVSCSNHVVMDSNPDILQLLRAK